MGIHETPLPRRTTPTRLIISAALILGGIMSVLAALDRPTAMAHQAAQTAPAANEPLPYKVRLPMVARNYDAAPPIVSVQVYGDMVNTTPLTRVLESKATWVRNQFFWSSIEPSNTTPANYSWSSLDAQMQAVKDAKVNLIFTIVGYPAWATQSGQWSQCAPLKNPADLAEFAAALAARYPFVHYFEFCNEPDRNVWFGMHGVEYAAMLNAVYPAVKAANPSANVVLGGMALDWFIDEGGPFDRYFLRDVLSHCSGGCFDVANFHYYPQFRWRWDQYGPDIIGKANWIKQQLIQYNYPRPIITTETTWPSATSWGSPELQARFVPKVYTRGMAAGLLAVTWFSLIDVDSGLSGLMDANHTPRPAYYAMANFSTLLDNATFQRQIPPVEVGAAQVEAYEFSAPGTTGPKRLDVYWYECPSIAISLPYPTDCTDSSEIKINATRVARIDKLGNRVIINDQDDGVTDGRIQLTIQSSPIYIDYQP